MGYTIYKSTDASAPTLSGTAGDLVALLDACLVNGYGSKTAAGWAKSYSGTNKAVYRAPSGTSRNYFRVDDNATGTGGAKEALIRAFEAMTDVDTGTNPYPTTALTGLGLICRKSVASDATTRTWIVVADGRTCMVFIQTGDQSGYYWAIHLGEFYSLVASDAYNGLIIGRANENSGSYSYEWFGTAANAGSSTLTGHHATRSYSGTGGGVAVGKHASSAYANTNGYLYGTMTYPNPADGGLYLSPMFIHETSYKLRGKMRGLYLPLHAASNFTDGDTVTGTGTLAGKTFLFIKSFLDYSGNGTGVLAIETSDTLEQN